MKLTRVQFPIEAFCEYGFSNRIGIDECNVPSFNTEYNQQIFEVKKSFLYFILRNNIRLHISNKIKKNAKLIHKDYSIEFPDTKIFSGNDFYELRKGRFKKCFPEKGNNASYISMIYGRYVNIGSTYMNLTNKQYAKLKLVI